ncbi:MAG TPA: type II toxin-antitoxin system VapC family toxin [Thermoanaerobaculia bacterium]|nr:type II toxin-antitoxin system VapC family toxin [Thermoanaerobaculia bacterium]
MTAVVVDASVALKWVVEEEGSREAVALAHGKLAAPTLFLAESANALWAKARRGELAPAEVVERIEALHNAPVELVPLETLLGDAVRLALELEHPVYDCFYLALAAQRGGVVVTADRRFMETVRRHPERAHLVIPLQESQGRPSGV